MKNIKYIYESPDGGKTIYRREFGKYDKKIVMNNTMMSLYDYLGRAAGPELGQQVASAAARKKVKFSTRYVEQGGYKGDVMLYPKSFLDEYFGGGTDKNGNNKQMLFG